MTGKVARIDAEVKNIKGGGLGIVGRAVDATGQGAPFAKLHFNMGDGQGQQDLFTDEHGDFTVYFETPPHLRLVPSGDGVDVRKKTSRKDIIPR